MSNYARGSNFGPEMDDRTQVYPKLSDLPVSPPPPPFASAETTIIPMAVNEAAEIPELDITAKKIFGYPNTREFAVRVVVRGDNPNYYSKWYRVEEFDNLHKRINDMLLREVDDDWFGLATSEGMEMIRLSEIVSVGYYSREWYEDLGREQRPL